MKSYSEAKAQHYQSYHAALDNLRTYAATEKERITSMPDNEHYRKMQAIAEYYKELDRLMLRVNNAWQKVERIILDEYRTIEAMRITHETNTRERILS